MITSVEKDVTCVNWSVLNFCIDTQQQEKNYKKLQLHKKVKDI